MTGRAARNVGTELPENFARANRFLHATYYGAELFIALIALAAHLRDFSDRQRRRRLGKLLAQLRQTGVKTLFFRIMGVKTLA